MDITAEYLRSRLDYDPATGFFTWRYNPDSRPCWNGKHAGMRAGRLRRDGYIEIKLDGKLYPAARLAWLWMSGDFPSQDMDHYDCNRSNNIFSNLRLATRSENQCNRPLAQNNTSGIKGVSWYKRHRKWSAKIGVNGRRLHLGNFTKLEDAADAYAKAAAELHGDFARLK